MKNIIYILIVIFSFSSCVKEKDLFIPTNEDYPTNSLKSVIPSKSLDITLNNDELHMLSTDFNSYIEIDKEAFIPRSEGENNYELKVIELRDYVDYILQNVDHESSIGITNTIYSFYVAAEQDGKELGFNEGKTIRIRFPNEKIQGELALGFGEASNNTLKWDYFASNVDSRVSYFAWETILDDGSKITEYGYQIIVNKSGWYSLVTTEPASSNTNSLCVNFEAPFNGENTAVYVLMNDKNYISKMKMINDNSSTFCLNNLPNTNQKPFTVISISKTDENRYHYYESQVEINNDSKEISAMPIEYNLSEIKNALQDL